MSASNQNRLYVRAPDDSPEGIVNTAIALLEHIQGRKATEQEIAEVFKHVTERQAQRSTNRVETDGGSQQGGSQQGESQQGENS